MRNIYSKDFEKLMIRHAKTKTFNQLLKIAQKYYDMDKNKLLQYLSKRKIRYVDYNKNKAKDMSKLPIGTEYTKPDGMILVKIAKDKWKYKQRLIYEQAYGKIAKNKMIIFLNGDRTDFSIDNLMEVDAREYNWVRNKDAISNSKDNVRTAILAARLYYKAKEKVRS